MTNLNIDTSKFVLEDADEINKSLGRFNRPGFPPVTINREVTRWSWFVGRVEEGVIANLEEYAGHLETRDLLDRILAIVPPSVQQKMTDFLEPWDKRFEEATERVSQPVSPGRERGERWYRVPKNKHPRVHADLREKGIS